MEQLIVFVAVIALILCLMNLILNIILLIGSVKVNDPMKVGSPSPKIFILDTSFLHLEKGSACPILVYWNDYPNCDLRNTEPT